MKRRYKIAKLRKRNLLIYNLKVYFLTVLLLIVLIILLSILKKPDINIFNKPKVENEIKIIKKLTRDEAYTRGMDMINYIWKYDSELNGIKNNEEVELPKYLRNVKEAMVNGIPYCWGGYLALDISNRAGVKNFQAAINNGYTAGNVKCGGNYKSLTAGLDCSGFVCAVFDIPQKYDTLNLYKYFKKINRRELKPMDIFNCENKHVFIFIKETSDKKGVLTMETTINDYVKDSEKTNIYYRSWESIAKGVDGKPYSIMRYKGIIEGSVNFFRDKNEYNNCEDNATNIELGRQSSGSIDYANDQDYFKIKITNKSNYEINLIKRPLLCRLDLLDSNSRKLYTISKEGTYNFDLPVDTYYVKLSEDNLQFDTNNNYIFLIKDNLRSFN